MSQKTTGAGPGAFAELVSMPADTDKQTLIATIDRAVMEVVTELGNHDRGDLPQDTLIKVQTSLTFLERCLAFKDHEFSGFARKRASELENALANTLKRVQESKRRQEPEVEPSPELQTPAPAPQVKEEATSDVALEEEPQESGKKTFPYEREEKLLIDYAFDRICKRLAFLRGDMAVTENGKAQIVSGIKEDGVPPLFLLSPQFPDILRQAFVDLIVEKRDLISRRVYMHTHREDSDEEVLKLYSEERYRDIDGIVGLAFDDWAGEIARAGIAGLPQEKKVLGGKKQQESSGGFGSSLKKVFSLGGKSEKKTKKLEKSTKPDSNPVRIHKEWQELERKGVFNLSQHFSYGLLSYALQLSESQFNTEYECICQIVNQQEEPDVGPVITNLSRLYKFYDNIFFDLVILVLFQRKNKFDINMLQAACMSQNFVIDRLPLTMDELRRRPLEHAKHVLRCLREETINPDRVKAALHDYFYVHETVHASKVGKRIQASENHLKRQGAKLKTGVQGVIEEIEHIFSEIANLKHEQEEEGVFLGEEIQTAIDEGIDRALLRLR